MLLQGPFPPLYRYSYVIGSIIQHGIPIIIIYVRIEMQHLTFSSIKFQLPYFRPVTQFVQIFL